MKERNDHVCVNSCIKSLAFSNNDVPTSFTVNKLAARSCFFYCTEDEDENHKLAMHD